MLRCTQYGKVRNMAANFLTDMSPARRPLPPPSNERFARPRLAEVRTSPKGELVRTRDGRELRLRAIEPGDVAAPPRGCDRLSPEDIRRRFLHAMSELPAPMAQRLSRVDPAVESAYVLMDETVQPAEMRGVGRIYVDEAANSAEFSVLVERDWARVGLGARAVQRQIGRAH